jgi:ATP-binding protein involved in chromosome partitioning
MPLEGVKCKIAVSSGKGGVGKSTVSANLAIALSKAGYKVGLLDADIYGPSIPKMFNIEDARPVADENGKIMPIEKYGIKILSIGFFVNPESAIVWRGAMASNAIKQLINDAALGDLDFFLIDLPPGTSDIHLSIVGTIKLDGAVVVSTPQQVALADAIKGIDMFQNDKVNVPILGLIENMSWFTPKELPENKYYIFGKDGVKNLAEKRGLKLLGQIPLVQGICDSGDAGTPIALKEDDIIAQAFENVAKNSIFAELIKE